jgi:hypothetical protein
MDAVFASQQTVGVFAFDLNGGGLDAGFFTGSGIEHRGAKSFFFGPAEIHAKKHLRPILRFGAAGARLDGDDGVEAVFLLGKKKFRFELGDEFIGGDKFLGEIFE